MKKYLTMTVAAAALFTSVSAFSGDAEDKAIEYRKQVFSVMKWHFAPMAEMIKGKVEFNAAEFERRAGLVASLSQMPLEGFIAGTDSGDTDAKAEIWQQWDKFEGGMDKLKNNTAALAEAAKGSDMDAIKTAFGEVGKTCKGCHDNFRNKD